jgi:hypothetical protein
MLTVDQVLAWRTYYGLPLDKDVSEALKVLGEPDINNKFARPVEPFFPDRISHGICGTGLLSVVRPQYRAACDRISAPSDVLNVTEFLDQPEMFIFESGHSEKKGVA